MSKSTSQQKSSPQSIPPLAGTAPEYANTRGCLWMLALSIATVAIVVVLVVLFGDF